MANWPSLLQMCKVKLKSQFSVAYNLKKIERTTKIKLVLIKLFKEKIIVNERLPLIKERAEKLLEVYKTKFCVFLNVLHLQCSYAKCLFVYKGKCTLLKIT